MKNKNLGFTLIELLVVVLIIGILAAIAVPKYQISVLKSKTQRARFLLNTLKEAEEIFYLATGEYTENLNLLDISVNSDQSYEFSNTPEGLSDKDYQYSCSNQYCIASSANKNLPYLLYYFQKYHKGIQLCAIDGKEEKAKVVCEQIGKLDAIFDKYDWGKDKYYRIN